MGNYPARWAGLRARGPLGRKRRNWRPCRGKAIGMICRLRFAWIAVVLPLGVGCLTPVKNSESINNKPTTPAAKQVKTAGACFDLGEGHQAAYTVDEFVGKVSELLSAG